MTFRILLTTLLLASLSCGGSSTDVASGGIGGTGISSGPVTAIGSRVVTGTSWDVSGAEITSDGNTSFDEDDLALGVVTVVEGERSADGLTGYADSVDFDNRIRGPVENVGSGPLPGDTVFEIFGVSVLANGGTFLEPSNLVLANGMYVDVYGLEGAGGEVNATRIEERGDDQIELKGFVMDRSGSEFTLDLGSNLVDVTLDSGAPCAELTEREPAGLFIEDGMFVEVTGFEDPLGSEHLCADRVELEEDAFGEDEDEVEIDGIVTDFVGLGDFRVDGTLLDATGADFFPPTLATTLGDDDRVEVEGDIVGGVLRAKSVHRVDDAVVIKAAVDDIVGNVLMLLGVIEVEVDGSTEFSGESSNVGEIDRGDFLEIEAVETSDGLVATFVDDEGVPDGQEVELGGPVDAIDSSGVRGLVILGVTVTADDPDTEFEGFDSESIAADRFYERIRVGDFVDATACPGPANQFDVACEVELDD